MNWIKETIKKWKRWLIGLFIPVAFAATLAADIPPEDTIYQIGMKHRYDYIACNGDYTCNQQAFQNNLITHPQSFPIWEEVVSTTGRGFEIIVWEEFPATTRADALTKLKEDTTYRAKALRGKNVLGFYATLYDFGQEK